MPAGIVAWGAYVPYWRLDRAAIGAALGSPGGKGTRAVASYDEDTTSMATEAARLALAASGRAADVGSISFTTAAPGYLDKTNATAIHAALSLRSCIPAYDFGGSVRSAFGALARGQELAMLGGLPLVTLADLRTGLPGGTDERDGGDGAAAFVFGGDGAVTEVLGVAHATEEFLDRWRVPGAPASGQWEERFGEYAYVPLGEAVVTDALKSAGLTAGELDHVVVVGPHLRSARRLAAAIGARAEAYAPDLVALIGNTGAAHLGIALCDILERAAAGQTILLVSLADGADAALLRTTDALPAAQAAQAAANVTTVAAQAAGGKTDLAYNTFLTWREMLHREPPRRPDLVAPAAPPTLRREGWKYGFTGSRCDACGTRHLPPARVCVNCHAVDQMSSERLADVQGTVATFTIDRLAFTLSPPVVAAVIDFDGGGRFACELTDLDPSEVHIGLRVEMTFRKLYTANGVHNYFWKAKPVRRAGAGNAEGSN
jgi:hydroxymethylglutaryl-CoA synthase